MALPNPIDMDCDADDLVTLVARIRALGPSRPIAEPSPEAIKQLAAEAAAEPPLSPEETRAWNRRWAGIVDEIHARDRADALADGRMLSE